MAAIPFRRSPTESSGMEAQFKTKSSMSVYYWRVSETGEAPEARVF